MLGRGSALDSWQPPSSWCAGSVDIADGRLTYHRTGGDGPALVLSHGLTDNGLCWFRFASALASDFDVIMLDARGHGTSSRMSLDRPNDPAADIAEAINQLRLQRPIVMGHSVGARATLDYAAENTDKISKVILEDPSLTPPTDPARLEGRRDRFRRHVTRFRSMSMAEIAAEGRASSPLWHQDEFPAWSASKLQTDPEAYPVFNAPWQKVAEHISVPTLLIHGNVALGSVISPSLAEEASSINDNIRTECIELAGHNVRRENFADFLGIVGRFIS